VLRPVSCSPQWLPNVHLGPWSVPFWNLFGFRGAIKIRRGLLLKLSGFVPVISRLNDVGWRRTRRRGMNASLLVNIVKRLAANIIEAISLQKGWVAP